MNSFYWLQIPHFINIMFHTYSGIRVWVKYIGDKGMKRSEGVEKAFGWHGILDRAV